MIRFSNFNWKNSCLSLLSVAMLSLLILAPTMAQAQGLPLYAVGQNNQLAEIDPVTGAVLNSTTVTLSGVTIFGLADVEVNPADGLLWGLIVDATPATHLVTIDPATGVATLIATTEDLFFDMAFNANGTVLWGVTMDDTQGVLLTAALYELNMTDATATLLQDFGTASSLGESIAFNPNDGLIYHLSGTGVLNTAEILETWDPANPGNPTVQITLSLTDFTEAVSIDHWAGNLFVVSDLNDTVNGRLFILNGATGEFQNMTLLTGQQYFGMTFAGSAPSCSPLSDLFGAAHQGSNGPSVFYTIDPADGTPTMVGPIGFERVGAMAFDGTGTLYGAGERMDGTNTSVLMTIDPCTGVGTEVGPTGIARSLDLSFENATGSLFGTSGLIALYSFNPATGAASLIGSLVGRPGNGLAFANDDTLYHSDTDIGTTDAALYTVDPATGTPTLLTALTFTAPADTFTRFNAMDVEPATGILFGSLNDRAGVPASGPPENYLATIDPGTGVVTIVGDGVTETQPGLDALAFRSKANLSVVKEADVASIDFGSNITYTITVTNDGPENSTGASFTDTLDSSLTLVSVTPDVPETDFCGTVDTVVTCDFGALAVGASDFATIIATTSAEGVVANTADSADAVLDEATPSDSSSTANVTVTTYTVGASPGTTVIKTNTSGTVTVTVTPDGSAFPNAVALACGSVPAGVTCSFNPASVDASGGAATSTLTITHAKKIGTFVPMAPPIGPLPLGLLMVAMLALMTLGMWAMWTVARRSPQFKLRVFLPAALLLGGVMLLAACGGAKAVSYSVTVSATSGAITKTTTVNVSTK